MSPFTGGAAPGSRHADRPLRLLLVEDNPGDARLLEELLGEVPDLGFDLTRVRTRAEAVEAIGGDDPVFDLVFLDLALPDSEGLDTVRPVVEAAAGVPVVVLTGREDLRAASDALAEGVQDYLVKGKVAPLDLARAIRTAFERQRVQRELEEERAQLEQIIDEAPAFMALYMGPDHELERANEAWYELVGNRDAVGRPARQVFPEFAGQGPLERLDRVYETGESIRLNPERIELASGEDGAAAEAFLKISYQPRRKAGEVVGVLVHGVDVTDMVRAHREVRARQQDLEAILGTAAEGIVFTDAAGRIQFANAAAEEIMGLEAAEITERDYADAEWMISSVDGDGISEADLPVARALRDGERVEEVEFVIGRGDGSRAVLSVNAAPLQGEDGEIQGAVASFRDVTERKQFERQLRRRALHDHLTGLPNRALFQDRLEQALGRTRRTGEGFALAYLDLKRFKVLNDNLGHAAGDRVLREVARRLGAAVREADTVARVGGDEFTVLFASIEDPEGARSAADRLTAALEGPVETGTGEVTVDASVGLTLCLDRETAGGVDASEVIRRADRAMYSAKDRPGTAYALAGPAESAGPGTQIEREEALRTALEEGRIHTVYQPIYDARDGGIRGVEALARWRHPERGSVSPGEFIPLAEESGLITRLGAQQLASACAALLALEDAPGLRLHVNCSARQLLDPDVVRRVRRILEETGFPAGRLTLEITETAAMQEPGALRELRGLGLAIAIDDFGTQYSSLAQVKRLEVDALKIDRSFVSGLPHASDDRAIVDTVLTLGAALDLEVVAEGVETEEQREALRQAGCDRLQGFLLSRPVPEAELEELVRDTTGRRSGSEGRREADG